MTPGGATALDIAEEAGHTACIDVLRKHGAKNGFGTDMEWWNEIMEEDEAEDEADEAEEDEDGDGDDDDDEEWETCSQEEWSSGDDSE
jgi:ankyrin repeat protein